MEISSNETIKQAVMAGLGIGFLSAHAVDLELRVKTLVALDVQGFPFLRNWHIVQRNGKRLPPVAVAFKDFLVEEGATLIKRRPPG
jgi:DNA-binding transcriptional LysR family regulator